MTLRALLALHAFVTAAAGIVLAIVPAAIPAAVGIVLDPSAYLVAYFISGAEFSIAYLSLRAVTLQGEALRLAVQTIVVFHAATGLLEMYALLQGVDPRGGSISFSGSSLSSSSLGSAEDYPMHDAHFCFFLS